MKRHPLALGIGDAGLTESLRAVIALPLFRSPPVQFRVDETKAAIDAEWPRKMLGAERDALASWTPDAEDWRSRRQIEVNTYSKRLIIGAPDVFSTAEEALTILESLPFTLCSLGTVFPDEWGPDCEPFGFGGAHLEHGWSCAFRGIGHDRLVSRRWLDFGPWRVLRRADDLTLVQFHALDLDHAAAYVQAHPGHERMGISHTGGFLQMPYPFAKDVAGLYLPDSRTLEIVVPPGGTLEQVRMRDACALRYMHRVEPPKERPIERIAYVFLDEDDARDHVHELWLRELECWVADSNGKRRIDLDYQPTPTKPAWVLALDTA